MAPKVALTLRILITLLLLPVLLFARAMVVMAWKASPPLLVRLLVSAVIAVVGVLSLLGRGV